MYGKLLIVAGFPTSGKTTYLDTIQGSFKNIGRRNFYTNRQPRSEEERLSSADYMFITNTEYEKLAEQSDWHWVEWYSHYYGFHIPSEIVRLQKGEVIAIGPAPHASYVQAMRNIHGKSNVLSILLHVDRETIIHRLSERPQHEHKRILEFNESEIEECAKVVDIVFVPSNNLTEDRKRFIEIVKPYLTA